MRHIKNIRFISLLLSCYMGLTGCSEDNNMKPFSDNQTPPGQVTNIQMKPGAGSVDISYTLPDDKDLLYVKAVYTLQSGKQREVRASYYTNSMTLDGFFDTEEHEVKIYSYNKSEVASDPVTIQVQPKESPIWAVRRSMELRADFMGVKIIAENEEKADLAIQVFYKDSLDKWANMEGIYTKTVDINQTLRGLDTLIYEMGAVIRDKFQNYTDTIFAQISPYFETDLEKSKYRDGRLPGDTPERGGSEGIAKLWDGNTTAAQRYMTAQPEDGSPSSCTIDIGQTAQLSRLKFWTYPEWMASGPWPYYFRGTPRIIEVWGSQKPNPDGSWDSSWYLLSRYEVIKPSGLPYGQMSDEDKRYAEAGFNVELDPLAPRSKYIRLKQILNWEGTTWLDLTEIQVYGDNRKQN